MPEPWKAHELRTARKLGGTRSPLSGSLSHHTGADVVHPTLYIECKYRKRFALLTLMRQVEKKARQEDKKPILVIQEKNGRHAYALVRLYDLEVLNETLKSSPGATEL